jgi:hypothetical protein
MLENKLAFVEKELQQVKKDNATLTHYIKLEGRRRRSGERRRPERR